MQTIARKLEIGDVYFLNTNEVCKDLSYAVAFSFPFSLSLFPVTYFWKLINQHIHFLEVNKLAYPLLLEVDKLAYPFAKYYLKKT